MQATRSTHVHRYDGLTCLIQVLAPLFPSSLALASPKDPQLTVEDCVGPRCSPAYAAGRSEELQSLCHQEEDLCIPLEHGSQTKDFADTMRVEGTGRTKYCGKMPGNSSTPSNFVYWHRGELCSSKASLQKTIVVSALR